MVTKQKSEILAISVLCLIVITVIGCQPSWVNNIGSDMDKMAKGYEKFGTVSMSSPILIEAKREPNGRGYFDFNLPAGPNEYYKDALAKVQGQSAIFDQFSETSGFGLNVQMNLIALMGYKACLNDYNLPHAAKNIAPDANNALRVLSGKNFTKFLGLLDGNSAPSISNRSAINTAAGDTVTEGIFRLLGNPAEAMKFKDQIIMFGVSMVSVNPGWLTNKNYTAELAVSCDYSYGPARRDLLIKLRENERGKPEPEKDEKLIELITCVLDEKPINKSEVYIPQRLQKDTREGYAPLSAAVSPMTDVDALDLASSQRRQEADAIRIAAALSYFGAQAQSEFIKEWVKRREHDVHTRTAYAAVTAFSDGGFFGWRIKPRLQALENPASFDSKPENVLGQQAFPVVVIVGIDRDDLQLGFDVESGRLVAYEPLILFRQTVSWLPNKSPWNLRERLSETERLNWAYSSTKATENLNKFDESKLAKAKEPRKGKAKYELAKEELAKEKAAKEKLSAKRKKQEKGVTSKSDEGNIGDEETVNFIENRILLLGYHTLDSWNEQYIPIDLMVTVPNAKGTKK